MSAQTQSISLLEFHDVFGSHRMWEYAELPTVLTGDGRAGRGLHGSSQIIPDQHYSSLFSLQSFHPSICGKVHWKFMPNSRWPWAAPCAVSPNPCPESPALFFCQFFTWSKLCSHLQAVSLRCSSRRRLWLNVKHPRKHVPKKNISFKNVLANTGKYTTLADRMLQSLVTGLNLSI